MMWVNGVEKQVRPSRKVIECDFTQSDCWFWNYYWRNNTTHTPWRDSWWLYIQSSYNSGAVTWAIPSSIYSIWNLQKVEIELYSDWVGNWWGLSGYNDSNWLSRVWGNGSRSTWAIESTWTGSMVSTSVPTPAGWYTLTIDIANWVVYTSTSSSQQTLSQTAIDSILNKWASWELYLCVMKWNANYTSYLRKATFYF